MRKAIFAGTFDPFTRGHYEIAKRASKLFDSVIVGIAEVSSDKSALSSVDQRLKIAEISVLGLPGVEVKAFTGLLTDFAEREHANVLIRGLRSVSDFEYEKNLCCVYKQQNRNLECMYLMSDERLGYISSSVVRQLAALGGVIDEYVCSAALESIKQHYGIEAR